MIDHLEFLVGEALVALRRNGWMSVAAISTCAMALMLLGGLGYLYYRISSYASSQERQFEINVYMADATGREEARRVEEQIRKLEGIAETTLVPREEAPELFKRDFPDIPLEGLDLKSVFPDRIKVKVRDVNRVQQLSKAIQAMEGVRAEGVIYSSDWQKFLKDALQVIRIAGLILGGLMTFTAGVLIFNAIRLTIVARQREIRIMSLVGATHSTVAAPFFIEGALAGALGGLIASLILFVGHGVAGTFASTAWFGGHAMPDYPWRLMTSLLIGAGAAYGIICTHLALRDRKKNR